jgi:hypothetical protein
VTKKEKTKARALQQRTNWGYARCLRYVRTMADAEIEALVRRHAKTAV